MIKNHQLHEDHLPSRELNIDEINKALSTVVGGPVDSDETLARPMGFGDTRMDMTLEDVNRHVANVEVGIVEAAEKMELVMFRKEQFMTVEKMIASAKDVVKSERGGGTEKDVVKGVVKFSDELLNVMLSTGVSSNNVDNGLIPNNGLYRVVSETNPKHYFYVNKEGYDYFRYVGVDVGQLGSSVPTAAVKMSDAEFVKQKPKKGKSGIMLYPAVVGGKQQWVTIPENESVQRAANITESKIVMNLKFLDRLAGKGDGYGFFGHNVRDAGSFDRDNRKLVDVIDQAFLDAAKEMKWNAVEVGVFGNSKDGRFLGDELTRLFDWADEEPVQVLAIDKKYKNEAGLKKAAKDLALKYMKGAKWMENAKGEIDDEQEKWMGILTDMGYSPDDVEF